MLDSLPRRLEEDIANLVGDRVLKMFKDSESIVSGGHGQLAISLHDFFSFLLDVIRLGFRSMIAPRFFFLYQSPLGCTRITMSKMC